MQGHAWRVPFTLASADCLAMMHTSKADCERNEKHMGTGGREATGRRKKGGPGARWSGDPVRPFLAHGLQHGCSAIGRESGAHRRSPEAGMVKMSLIHRFTETSPIY